MKRIVLSSMALFALAVVANAQGSPIGAAIENFSLPDLDGRTQTLGGLKGQKGAVVIFLSAECPAVKVYKDRINELAAAAQAKGIGFIGINSNSNETLGWVRSNASASGFRFPVLLDKGNKIADLFDVQATPEVYFINSENILLYRGAIDNDRTGRNATEKYLTAAFDAALAGRPISKTSVPPFGCAIRRVGR